MEFKEPNLTYDTSRFFQSPSPFVPHVSQEVLQMMRNVSQRSNLMFGRQFGVAVVLLDMTDAFFKHLDRVLPELEKQYGTTSVDLDFFKIGFCMPVKEIYVEFLICMKVGVEEAVHIALNAGPIPSMFKVYDFKDRIEEVAPYYNQNMTFNMGNMLPLFRDYLHGDRNKYPFIAKLYFQLGVQAAERFFGEVTKKL